MSEPAPTISPPSVSRDEAADLSANEASPHPPSEWQAAEQQLDATLQTLRDEVEERLRVLIESIETDLFDPLQATAHEAAAIHAALVKTSHFTSPIDEIPADLRWKRVRDYRRDTLARVIDPLRQTLVDIDIGTTLNERWHAFWDDLATLPSDLPVTLTRTEPDDLYRPTSEDSLLVVLRKRWVRTQRSLRFHSTAADGIHHAQEIPLRLLAAYHLRMRLPRLLAPHEAAFYQRFAQAVASFERAVTTWTHRLLDAERHLHRPADHLPGTIEPEGHALPDEETASASPSADALSPAEVWDNVGQEADALNEHLQGLASLSFEECPTGAYDAMQQGWEPLRSDIDRSGSFLLDEADRAISPSAPHDQRDDAPATQWPDWYRQATNRLAFCRTLADLRDASYTHNETLLQALITSSVQPLVALHDEATERLRALHDELVELFSSAPGPEALDEKLQSARERALQAVDDDLIAPLHEARLLGAIDEQIDEQSMPIDAFFETRASTFRLHALSPPETEVIAPDPDTREVDLRAIAQEHYDAFFTDALRERVQPLHQRIETILAKTKEVPSILRFNLEAAREELETPTDPAADPASAARELALSGLARSADTLETQSDQARAALPPLATASAMIFTQAWVALHDRARVETRIREQLLELRTLVNRETQEATERAERRFRAARIRLKRAFRLGQGRAEELVQMGRTAVGAGTFDEDAFLETLETLASLDHVLADLPLVYRRLFSLRPVTDPSLLVGRQGSLSRVQRHIDQWNRGLSNVLVITGHHGSGLTSFLNVIQRTSLANSTVRWLSLDGRLRSESAFAEQIVRTLRLPLSPQDGNTLSLNQVREHLLAQPRPDAPRVCIVEHLEHLFLRSVHGTDLASRVLTFMSRTDSRVLWLATLSDHGWQLLDRAESAASGLVLRHRLTPLSRPELEKLILLRHQRSGLQLQFNPPDDPGPLLQQRLRKAGSETATQDILREDYFDRLHAQCGSNIMLALFYWVRSVDLDEDNLVMHVRPVKSLDFSFLEQFSMQQAFTLKSLLDHATLTIEEYSEAAHLPLDTSLELFESLGNALLIQPADADHLDAESPFATIEPTRRYRLRPLIIHPVMKHLREKNILH